MAFTLVKTKNRAWDVKRPSHGTSDVPRLTVAKKITEARPRHLTIKLIDPSHPAQPRFRQTVYCLNHLPVASRVKQFFSQIRYAIASYFRKLHLNLTAV